MTRDAILRAIRTAVVTAFALFIPGLLGWLNAVTEWARSEGSTPFPDAHGLAYLGVVAIVGLSADGKAGIVVGVTEDLTKRFNAVDLVKKGAEALGGKGGGGRPDMAQAGGPDGSKAEDALKAIEAALGG